MNAQKKSYEMSARTPVIVGLLAILYGSLKGFDDPRLQAIFLSCGAISISFGILLYLASMENPKTRLGIWLLAIQLLGVAVLIELALQVDSIYLLGVAGVLAVVLLSIGVVRGEIKLHQGP